VAPILHRQQELVVVELDYTEQVPVVHTEAITGLMVTATAPVVAAVAEVLLAVQAHLEPVHMVVHTAMVAPMVAAVREQTMAHGLVLAQLEQFVSCGAQVVHSPIMRLN
jgi:hypothetical protein